MSNESNIPRAKLVIDTGWTMVCDCCDARFGGPEFGERELFIVRCEGCKGKKSNAEIIALGSGTLLTEARREANRRRYWSKVFKDRASVTQFE